MKPQPRYQPGDRIGGRYQVHKALMGGMGEVYLCLDLDSTMPVALKTVQEHALTNAALRQRFTQEVMLWVAIENHPHIVRCFQLETIANQPFIVLEWIQGDATNGTDLRQWLQHRPLDLRYALTFTIQLCYAICYVQQKTPGLVHRDLKPENILVDQYHRAKITDFGLAHIGQHSATSQTGKESAQRAISGTPLYMAPEQWLNETDDERTDIYAIGCILYELLCGRPPFVADHLSALYQAHLAAPIPTIANSSKPQASFWRAVLRRSSPVPAPTVPPAAATAIDIILARCLAKVRTERPTGAELLVQLNALYEEQFAEILVVPPAGATMTAAELNNRGTTYNALGYYDKGLADFNRALDMDPTDAKVFGNRAITHLESGQFEAALADCNRAIELDPAEPIFYVNRSTIYGVLGRTNELLADLEQALQHNPNHAQAYHNRAATYVELGRYAEALADLDCAIACNPTRAKSFFDRAALYRQLRRPKQALADYTHAIELDPMLMSAYVNRGNLYVEYNRLQEALADFEQALQIDPTVATSYNSRGSLLHMLGEYDAAIDDYTSAIKLNPVYIQAYYNRAGTYNDVDRYTEAITDGLKVLELDPTLGAAYVIVGSALANQGELTAALPYFERAAQLGEDDGAIYADHVQQMLANNRSIQ